MMMQAYSFAQCYTEDGIIENKFLLVEEGKILGFTDEIDYSLVQFFDHHHEVLIPGVIDIHNHGYMGFSATCADEAELNAYSLALASAGVTGVLATTQELDTIERVALAIEKNAFLGTRILGIHAEGPYRAEKFMGASKGFVWPKPSLEHTQKMWEASHGHLRYISISTELDNLDESIRYLLEKKVRLACGHSDCTYTQMREGIEKGITSVSHFGNALRPIHQRDAGAWGALLLDPNIYLEIIADHKHVVKETLEIFLRVKDLNHFVLISDQSELAGLPAGRYFARGKERIIESDGFIHLDDGTLSGSGMTILQGAKNLVREHFIPMEKVVPLFSRIPAKLFVWEKTKGSIAVGKDADFVFIDSDFKVVRTVVEGKSVYDKKENKILHNTAMKKIV